MEKVEFFTLARPVQERFVESSRGSSAPAPIAVARPPLDLAPVLWGGGSAALLLACAALTKLGYGNLDSPVALAPIQYLAIYAGLLTGSAVCAFRAAKLWHKPMSLPYRTGIYLFPIGVVDARGATLKVHKFDRDTSVSVAKERPLLRVVFPNGTTFEFPASDHATAEFARSSIAETQERISASDITHKARDLALLDPLCDNGFKNPFAPAEPMAEARPSWARFYVPIAVAIGVLVGAAGWQARNTLSAARLYAVARSLDTADAYQKYLARGGSSQDVVDTLLPRAELREAQAPKSVAAIEEYIAKHPNSRIQTEINAALGHALERELDAARAKNSLTALREFETRYAKYPFTKPAVEKAVAALVKSTLAKYQNEFGSGNERAAQLFTKLLAYTVEHGPNVEIRFRRKGSDSIERAEKVLQKSNYFAGEKSLPAQFFDGAHFEPREAEAAELVVERLKQVFPSDMLAPKLAPVLDDEAEVPSVKVPTLLITHRTEMSGAFLSKQPRIIFAGVGLIFRAQFLVPGDNDPPSYKQAIWRAPDIKKLEAEKLSAEATYEEMARDAFKKFTKRYLGTLFKES